MKFQTRQKNNNISLPDIGKKLSEFFSRQGKTLFVLSLVGVFLFCVYIWYENIYASGWSEAEKSEYLNSKDKGVDFNRKGFNVLVEKSAERQVESEKKLEPQFDIFRLKK